MRKKTRVAQLRAQEQPRRPALSRKTWSGAAAPATDLPRHRYPFALATAEPAAPGATSTAEARQPVLLGRTSPAAAPAPSAAEKPGSQQARSACSTTFPFPGLKDALSKTLGDRRA